MWLVVVFVAFLVEKSMVVAYCDDAMRFVVVTIVFLSRLMFLVLLPMEHA